MLITWVILMMIDVVHGQGRVTWWTTRFLLIKLFCQPFCICSGIVALEMEVQYLCLWLPGALWCKHSIYIQSIHKSYCSWPIHTKRCYWAVRMKAMKALYALYAKYVNFLVEKRTLVEKSKIINMKPNCIYSMQPIEQHYCH